jgi:uncharacterized iron-regulated protein
MKVGATLTLMLAAAGAGCASAPPAPPAPPTDLALGDPARRDRTLAVVSGAIVDTGTGARLDPDGLAARLEGKRLVLFGESHADPPAQLAERQLLEALARRGRRVQVGLEMLPASVQPALDRWMKGEGSEDDLLRATHWYRHWGFNFGHYRDIFLHARASRAPLVALNVEREVISKIRRVGLPGLSADERARLPPEVDLTSDEHRRLFAAYMQGGHGGLTPDALEGMFRAQCAWDAVMGWNAARALARDPDPRAVMVVLAGSGHVAYGLGIQRQAARWTDAATPPAAMASVVIVERDAATPVVRASYADFVWGTAPVTGRAPFPSLGASLSDKPGTAGPTVTRVDPGSPAAGAGLRAGDAITAVDGVATPDKESALLALGRKRWGDRAQLTVTRPGVPGSQALSVTFDDQAVPATPDGGGSAQRAANPGTGAGGPGGAGKIQPGGGSPASSARLAVAATSGAAARPFSETRACTRTCTGRPRRRR